MKKILLIALGSLFGLFVLLLAIGMAFPNTYEVERSIEINAPAATVFPLVADLKHWKTWTSWSQNDPQMEYTYSDSTVGQGAYQEWKSETQGSGRLTITGSTPPSSIEFMLKIEDWGGPAANVSMKLSETDGKTNVVWVCKGGLDNNPVYRWFGLFMEDMIGEDYEQGLANLKTFAETKAKE